MTLHMTQSLQKSTSQTLDTVDQEIARDSSYLPSQDNIQHENKLKIEPYLGTTPLTNNDINIGTEVGQIGSNYKN